MNAANWIWAASLLLCHGHAFAEGKKTGDEVAVIEIGAAPNRNLKDHASSFGPTVAVEVSPIENWLELEAGVTPSFGHDTTEWATDLCSRSPGLSRAQSSSWPALGQSGFTQETPAQQQIQSLGKRSWTSCSGLCGGSTNLAGTSNRAMNTTLDEGMSDQSA
jgi:hypothetical protein